VAQEHALRQDRIGEFGKPESRVAGCVCQSSMVAVYSARKAYANYQDHLAAYDLPQLEKDRLLDEAWATLTGEKE